MRPFRTLLAAAFVLGALVLEAFVADGAYSAGSEEYRRVLVVHSYNPEYVWTQNINAGILEALKEQKVVFDYAYMDAKRHPDTPWLTQAGQKALERLRDFGPDVVIAADDVAQTYFVVPYLKGKTSPQVIFCGVNAPPAAYGYPARNVSGVRERFHFREGFQLLKRLDAKAKSTAFLVDASDSGRFLVDDIKNDIDRNGPYDLDMVAVESIATFQQWQKSVLRLQGQADTLALGLYHSLRDETTGKIVSSEEVMAWTNSVNTKPTLGFADFSLDHGILCGVLESGEEQGFLAGSMVRHVLLTGVSAGSLPVRTNDKGVILVNLKAAERFHMEIPYEMIEAAGSVILH